MRILASARGLTATELVVVVGISTLLYAMVSATSRFHVQAYRREYATNAIQPRLRLWIGRIATEIRKVGYDPRETGSFGLVTNTATELSFTVDADEDGVVDAGELVGIRLVGSELQMRRGSGSWRVVLPDVVNQDGDFPDHAGPVFTYLDGSGLETTAVGNVRAIRIDLSVRTETAGVPGQPIPVLSETVTATIRNDLLRGSG